MTVTQEPPSPEPVPTETVVVEVPWTHEPAAASSTIPLGAVITALLVLVVATTALVLALRRNRGARPTGVIAAAALEPAASTTEIGVLDDAHAVAIPGEVPTRHRGDGPVPHAARRGDDRLQRPGGPGDPDARTGRGDQRCPGRRGHRAAHRPARVGAGPHDDPDGRVVGGLATAAPAPGAGRARRGRRRRVRVGSAPSRVPSGSRRPSPRPRCTAARPASWGTSASPPASR